MMWGILFWAVVGAYLVPSPDKFSHTVTRGLWGAFRGWANPEYAATKTAKATKAGKGKAGWLANLAAKAGMGKAGRSRAAQGSRWHGMLAGWNAGVTVARQRRTEGKDLWSIGSKFAGRTWGGGESLVVGARRLKDDLAAWYRRQQHAADGPVVQGTVIDDEPEDFIRTDRDPAFTSVSEGGEVHDGPSPYGERPVPLCHRCHERLQTGEAEGISDAVLGLRQIGIGPLDLSGGRTWTCPGCRKTYDATNYPAPSRAGTDLAAEVAEGAPSEGEGAPSNTTTTTTPAFAGDRMNTMSDMSIGELDNLGAMKAEGVDSAGALIAMLGESMAAAKVWGPNFQERWSGTNWGTERIDNAVAMIAEGAEALGSTELMQSGVAELQAAIEEAQGLAEMAAEVKATGDVSSFAEA